MNYSREDIIDWLSLNDCTELCQRADKLRKECARDELQVRAIIEISSYCRCNCSYCGLRNANKALARYRIPEGEVLHLAKRAWEAGFKTVVLQSGEDTYYSGDRVTDLVRRIKAETALAITLSLGDWSREEYGAWREAGADRYLLKHESINSKLYAKLHPGGDQKQRLENLWTLRELGYQVGSGGMVGIPGQTLGDLADDILFCAELDVDMAGFGPYICHPDTPLAGSANGTPFMTLKTLAAARLVLRETHLPATTSLVVIDPTFRNKALRCGANVIMPDITPAKYRNFYDIYPGKGSGDDHIDHVSNAFSFASNVASELNWQVATHPGHSLKNPPA